MKNPFTAIWRGNATLGIRLIALSLLVLLLSALPLMLYVFFGPKEASSMPLTMIFAVGAVLSHLGFFIGLLLLIYDMFFKSKR